MKWINCQEAPIKIYGLALVEGTKFYRLPESIIDKVNEGVTELAKNTAGACIRFSTDSKTIAVKVKLLNAGNMNHMPLSGQSGVAIYINNKFKGTARPVDASLIDYEASFMSNGETVDVDFYLPLYNGVKSIQIGINDDAVAEAPIPYKYEKPVLFYGSSITQGGCASHPGNAYCAILSRWLNAAQINLGFSGSGRGEEIMAKYIASLDLSAFVMDYDHNAPSAEHLMKTHYNFYDIIRQAKPDLPVVIVTKPDFDNDVCENTIRRSVIFETYERAFKNGDRNIYFVDGESLYGKNNRDSCTVDSTHPNDLGFMRMAEGIYPTLKSILK